MGENFDGNQIGFFKQGFHSIWPDSPAVNGEFMEFNRVWRTKIDYPGLFAYSGNFFDPSPGVADMLDDLGGDYDIVAFAFDFRPTVLS